MFTSFTKTEESILTLFSLYVLIGQAHNVVDSNKDILNAEVKSTQDFEGISNSTIKEALIHQILLNSCSFVDEWNKVFSSKANSEHHDIVVNVKKICKPAWDYIDSWKELRVFRNHFIAHNFRNDKNKSVFLNPQSYHSPRSHEELSLLVLAMEKMMNSRLFLPGSNC